MKSIKQELVNESLSRVRESHENVYLPTHPKSLWLRTRVGVGAGMFRTFVRLGSMIAFGKWNITSLCILEFQAAVTSFLVKETLFLSMSEKQHNYLKDNVVMSSELFSMFSHFFSSLKCHRMCFDHIYFFPNSSPIQNSLPYPPNYVIFLKKILQKYLCCPNTPGHTVVSWGLLTQQRVHSCGNCLSLSQ